jgi:hypothetical protein
VIEEPEFLSFGSRVLDGKNNDRLCFAAGIVRRRAVHGHNAPCFFDRARMRLAGHCDGENSYQLSGSGTESHGKIEGSLRGKESPLQVHRFFGVRRSAFGPNATSDQENRQRHCNKIDYWSRFVLSGATRTLEAMFSIVQTSRQAMGVFVRDLFEFFGTNICSGKPLLVLQLYQSRILSRG